MSYEMSTKHATRVGARPFNHSQSQAAEEEYDRLRNLARQEASKRATAFQRSQEAYANGDGAAAHALSQEGKEHGAKMEMYNKQAAEFIFRENNADGRVAADTIDLHGLYVEEAEEILEQRIRYAQSQGQTHLHVVVGKGNHSPDHIQKLKPRVEQTCRDLGLQYHTEANEGRIYIKLDGSPVEMQHVSNWQGYQTYPDYQQQPWHPQQAQQSQPYPAQGQGQYDGEEKVNQGLLSRLINKLLRMLCG
ncbi:uncharacterized protein Z520_11954 [Fonsecaea multimorphosa CBS 102226]|uniref:Smr domain-containing protein n=1 Tax=Fonsecaea multimorphosa CBS 102226 TaxID=1442371 RepID=A0A0D2I530_9EURO|nr:uncharacterized protein Z520_11954 [Fonsecaea multimorphosa CBS 102226]KIX92346.1 hypothetical protein Z520_11954 [Fonsecaea multimorphosa CBS 102226]OAL17719.1 hypothetical protein AYO22_11375 [Fonsecaea multimorphosa]